MADTGFKEGTTSVDGGTGFNFTNRNNMLTSTSTNASIGADSVGDTEAVLYGFDFSAVSGTIDGFEIQAEADDGFGDGGLVYGIRLSWDSGTSWTHTLAAPVRLPTAGTVNTKQFYLVGGATDTFGRSWTTSELASGTFRVSIFYDSSASSDSFSSDCRIYRVQAKTYYTAAGGANPKGPLNNPFAGPLGGPV